MILWRFIAGLLVLLACAESRAGEWGGSLTASGSDLQSDTVRSQTYDQQYQLYFSDHPFTTFNYSATLRYRRLATEISHSPSLWSNEWQPALVASWTNSLFKVDASGEYRDNQDRQQVNNFAGRSVGIRAQSNLSGWPRLFAGYQWERNVNDLDLLGVDTRQRLINAGADYSTRAVSLRYEYNDFLTRNPSTGLDQVSRRHMARTDETLFLFQRALTIQPSYQILYRTETERSPSSGKTLLSLPASGALYSTNPSPGFGALDPEPTLIDGNLTTAASSSMNLSGGSYQNLGLDFGSPITLDHIFVYTDTLGNPDLRWSIYSSEDNLTWAQVQGYGVARFDIVNDRYEISFSKTTARYIKAVDEPALRNTAVFVTEIRGLVANGETGNGKRPVDQNGGLDVRFRPVEWLSLSAGGTAAAAGRSQSAQARNQNDFYAALNLQMTSLARVSGRFQRGYVAYPDVAASATANDMMSFGLESQWMRTLTTRATVSRQREFYNAQMGRRLDGLNVQVNEIVFPALRGVTQMGGSEDHRLQSNDIFKTTYVAQTMESEPTAKSTLALEYRWDRLEARGRSIPSRRENATVRGGYDLTSTVAIRASGTAFREPANTSYSWNGVVSWLPTPTMSFNGGYSRTEPGQGAGNILWTLDGDFRVANPTDVTVSFARSTFPNDRSQNNNSLRAGLTTRF